MEMVELNRRRLVGSLLGAAGAASMPMSASARVDKKSLAEHMGIQIHMLADDLVKDFSGTLKKVHDIGYREVETAFDHGSPTWMRAEFDKAGLACPSVHIPIESFVPGTLSLEDIASAIHAAKAIGATNIVVPIFPFKPQLKSRSDFKDMNMDISKFSAAEMAGFSKAIDEIGWSRTSADWLDQANQLNKIGSMLAREGLRLSYHNHGFELAELPNGKTALDLLMDATNPKLVAFELDVGWVKFAGRDPAAVLKRYRDRITQLHLKDLAPGNQPMGGAMRPANVGEGVMDWSAIIGCLPNSMVQHVYVEQEPPFTEVNPPLLAVRKAYDFLQPRMLAARV